MAGGHNDVFDFSNSVTKNKINEINEEVINLAKTKQRFENNITGVEDWQSAGANKFKEIMTNFSETSIKNLNHDLNDVVKNLNTGQSTAVKMEEI